VKRKGLERVAASSSSPERALISAFKRGQIVEIRSISPEGFLYDTSRAVLRVTFTIDKYYYAYAGSVVLSWDTERKRHARVRDREMR